MVIPGLESVAADEITRDLAGPVQRTGRGIVVFGLPAIDVPILRLLTVEDVFLLAWGSDQLTYRAEDLGPSAAGRPAKLIGTRCCVSTIKYGPNRKASRASRLVTQMTGQHGYRRQDAREALAQGLAGKLPSSWRHAEDNAAVEIWLTINENTAVCGVRLSDRTMRHRHYKIEHLPASLRPSVAAAMVRLAGAGPGQVVLDPMCGAATILAEQALLTQSRYRERGRGEGALSPSPPLRGRGQG